MYLCAEVYKISHTEWLKWEDGDRQKAIAWELRKRETCPRCSTRPDEWQGGKRLYKPHVHQCIGCRELAKTNKTIPEKARDWSHAVMRRILPGGGRSGGQ